MRSRSGGLFPGCPHHLTQRGYRHRAVFFDDNDPGIFVRILADEARRGRIGIWAWALMSNHVHLIVVPPVENAVRPFVEIARARYEQAVVERHGLTGPLWQPRYYASVLDRQEFLWRAVRYVERNPVEARIARRAEDYPWSSAPFHCGLRTTDPLVSPESPLRDAIADWARWLAGEDPAPSPGPNTRFISRLDYLRDADLRHRKRRRSR